MKPLREVFRRCDDEALVFGFVHNHPFGIEGFSQDDDVNELRILEALSNRNGVDVHLVSLVLSNDSWVVRVRSAATPDVPLAARHISVLGGGIFMHGYKKADVDDKHMHARQAAAFGAPFVDMLRSLRVGVVGGGGTGSPTVTLLARAGVGELVLIDNDLLEASNLNRVRGAGLADVGKNKAKILGDFLGSMGLPVRVAVIDSLVDASPSAVDALSSCDVIFGCTDDQVGREIMNASLYFYLQAYIDVGLGGRVVDDKNGVPYLRYHHGRVSTILPESGECLFCQGVVSEAWIRHQYALRDNPYLTEEEANERYLEGGGEDAPGVGPFTSATADFGVAGLFDLLRPFRRMPPELRADYYTIDFVTMQIRSKQVSDSAGCPFCKSREYVAAREKYRLGRPALGKQNEFV
jgi:hypothetical protein